MSTKKEIIDRKGKSLLGGRGEPPEHTEQEAMTSSFYPRSADDLRSLPEREKSTRVRTFSARNSLGEEQDQIEESRRTPCKRSRQNADGKRTPSRTCTRGSCQSPMSAAPSEASVESPPSSVLRSPPPEDAYSSSPRKNSLSSTLLPLVEKLDHSRVNMNGTAATYTARDKYLCLCFLGNLLREDPTRTAASCSSLVGVSPAAIIRWRKELQAQEEEHIAAGNPDGFLFPRESSRGNRSARN